MVITSAKSLPTSGLLTGSGGEYMGGRLEATLQLSVLGGFQGLITTSEASLHVALHTCAQEASVQLLAMFRGEGTCLCPFARYSPIPSTW